ncbi:MAG: class II aldolase/adducin family protein [Polyangiales bacterium]
MTDELTRIGDELGGLDHVQGPGGNASVKDGDALVVKASGVRLRDLADPASRARVPLARVLEALDGDAAAEREVNAAQPRPSLEAYFHALGPRVVAHTHPLGALLVACASGREVPSVAGARVVEVGYARPGRPLALLVRDALGTVGGATLVLLRAHGLIAYADSAAAAIVLTRAFDDACRARFGEATSVGERVARYRQQEARAVTGGLALPLPGRARSDGALFPDAAVFCPEVAVASLGALDEVASQALSLAPRSAVLTDGERRALVAPSSRALDYALEVLAAHEVLAEALGGDAAPLPDDEARAVASMPSELHRLARAASA